MLVPTVWCVHFLTCYYIIRHINNCINRLVLTALPCILLTYMSCRDLPQYQMVSIIPISACWMISIRLIESTAFSPNTNCPLSSFLLKPFWTIFPIVSSDQVEQQSPIIFDFIWGFSKLIINHWVFRWFLNCPPNDSYVRVIMLSTSILTGSHISDIQMGFVRLVTRNKYTLYSISNYPLFSKSLREFWGLRYNRLTSSVFRECIFQPINSYLSSPSTAAMSTFIISGLLHVHINLIILNDTNAMLSTFLFFFLNGVGCCAEKYFGLRLPGVLGWFLTHLFLLFTLPLSTSSYAKQGPLFYEQNPPLFIDAKWLPQLPVLHFCFE